jgi:CRP-like cAMP-binding protein
MKTCTSLQEIVKRSKILETEQAEWILEHFQVENLKKNQFCLETGNRSSRIGFLESGILCSFIYNKEGEEVVKHFVEAGQFFTDIDSYEKGIPTNLNIQAVVNSRVLYISKTDNQKINAELPQWGYLLKQFAAEALNLMIRNRNFLQFGSAVEQYQHFLKHHPNLAQNVPLKYIASYLGITQSSLSRIRREWG